MSLPEKKNAKKERDFECRVIEHYPSLHSYALNLSRNEQDAADLIQDTLLRAWKYYHRFDDQSFKGWIFTICRSIFFTQYRKKYRKPALVELEPFNHPLYEIKDGFSDEVSSVLHSLSLRDQRVATLSFMHKYEYKEIAEAEGIPIGTVRSIIHRVRNRFVNDFKGRGLFPLIYTK